MGIKYSFDKGIYSFVAGVSSPTMAAVLSGNNVEEEYMWSCTLDKTNTELCWSPADPADSQDDEEDDPNVKPGHRLLIKKRKGKASSEPTPDKAKKKKVDEDGDQKSAEKSAEKK